MVFIAEAFLSGCISKIINDGKDYSWTKIKKVVNDKSNRNLSTKIYRIIENALNIVTDKKFEDTDKLYDAIETIFIEFRDNGDTIKSVKCGLELLCSDISDQICINFLDKFYEEIRQDDDLYKTISMMLQQKGIKISQEGFQQLNEKIDSLTEIVSNRNDYETILQDREPVKSRTQEYANKVEINAYSGGQVIFVKDNGNINAIQNNVYQEVLEDNTGKSKMGMKLSNKRVSIFISYSRHDTGFVDGLDDKLQQYGYDIKRDIRDAEYAQSFKEFMKKIRKTDYSVIVLSDDFLKSENCMREIFEFIKDDNYKERIIPVILESAKDIWGDNKGITYTIYWKEREDGFKEQLKKIDEESKAGYIEDLKHISSVKDSIGDIIKIFRDMKMFDASESNLAEKINIFIKKKEK